MKPYEGLPAYEAGIIEGRKQANDLFKEVYKPTILNMLMLISETTADSAAAELANDCYNFLIGASLEKK